MLSPAKSFGPAVRLEAGPASVSPVSAPGPHPVQDLIPARGGLPPGLVLAGQFTGQLRAFLDSRALHDWDIYYLNGGGVHDVDHYLADLGGGDARWQPHPDAFNGGEQPSGLSSRGGEDDGSEADATHATATDSDGKEILITNRAGFLWLRQRQIVIARWFLYDLGHHTWRALHLCAAPSPRPYLRLKEDLNRLRRTAARNVWQIVTGEAWRDERVERDPADGWDQLILDPIVRKRLQTEIGGFFTEPVARLYRELNLPYRRGLLLYGPPGNGKTSLIRVIGNLNPDVPGLLLRPGETFDDNDLKNVIGRWQEQAPSILVIEDLDWLFHSARLNVSTFLNMLDGVDRRDGGLLLIATSNHPESLDPAVNNRPGRFDIAVEVTSPDARMRDEFFRRSSLAGSCGPAAFQRLVSLTEGLSFSHLREVESQSGLSAVQEGRASRTEHDVLQAAERVAHTHAEARKGFPEPVVPFGLGIGRKTGRDA